MPQPAIVFHPGYDISFLGLESYHPFDSRKYGRAWAELQRRLGPELSGLHITPDRPANDEELRHSHTAEYLGSLDKSSVLASALELSLLAYLPAFLTHWRILTPMRWAVRGTILAAQAALERGLAINLAGGYHHAKPDSGEGFCLFADAAIAVRVLRAEGRLTPTARVVHIDLDAHQGNGVCHQFLHDPTVFLYDQFNAEVYPLHDPTARERIDCPVPVRCGCTGEEYLGRLRERLPPFLESLHRSEPISLVLYNAGTDVIEKDPLGQLALKPEDVTARDCFVVEQCRLRGLPVAMVPSGGYTRESYHLLAASAEALLRDAAVPV